MKLKASQKTSHLTESHKPGFSQRLDNIFNAIHSPQRGRQAAIARMADMSVPGTKDCLENDRPPKQLKNFNALSKGLAALIKQQNYPIIDAEVIASYLLGNQQNPLSNLSPLTEGYYDLSREDPVYIGQVYLLINQIGEALGMNIYKMIGRDQLEKLYASILPYCLKHNVDLDSSHLREMIECSIKLAKASMLR